MNLEEEMQIKLECSIDKAAIKCMLPPDGAEERGLEKEFREIIGHAIEPIFKEFASLNATLKAGLDTAIKCGDTQRRKIAELESDVVEAEHSIEAFHKEITRYTPFDLPARHHVTELLHEWRKRWDEKERKIADLEHQLTTASRVEGVDGTMPRPEMPTFQELEQILVDWTDVDYAAFQIGVALGLWPSDQKTWQENKHVVWSNNCLGNALQATLQHLVGRDILERRDTPDQQYRWKGA